MCLFLRDCLVNSLVEKALVGSALGDDALVGASSAERTVEGGFPEFFFN